MNKVLLCGALLLCCCTACYVGLATAADKGPAEITLQATIDPAPTPKPSQFPHAAHQERLECGVCHHGKDADGKKIAYSEGQKIEKCEKQQGRHAREGQHLQECGPRPLPNLS